VARARRARAAVNSRGGAGEAPRALQRPLTRARPRRGLDYCEGRSARALRPFCTSIAPPVVVAVLVVVMMVVVVPALARLAGRQDLHCRQCAAFVRPARPAPWGF